MGMTSLLSRGKGAAGSSSERDYGTKGPNESDLIPDNDSEAGMHSLDPSPPRRRAPLKLLRMGTS